MPKTWSINIRLIIIQNLEPLLYNSCQGQEIERKKKRKRKEGERERRNKEGREANIRLLWPQDHITKSKWE